jgi:hypothetical protein
LKYLNFVIVHFDLKLDGKFFLKFCYLILKYANSEKKKTCTPQNQGFHQTFIETFDNPQEIIVIYLTQQLGCRSCKVR